MNDNQTKEKYDTPLLSENPIFIEKRKEVENFLNSKSKPIFIIMLILIAVSVIFSIFLSLTRKPREFNPTPVSIENTNYKTGVGEFNSLYSRFKELKEEEKKVDNLLIEIQKEYENRPER